jgi:uncharacterized protein YfkK (UPF0435 family)
MKKNNILRIALANLILGAGSLTYAGPEADELRNNYLRKIISGRNDYLTEIDNLEKEKNALDSLEHSLEQQWLDFKKDTSLPPKIRDMIFPKGSENEDLQKSIKRMIELLIPLNEALLRERNSQYYADKKKAAKKDDLPQDLPAQSPQKPEPEKSLADAPKVASPKAFEEELKIIENDFLDNLRAAYKIPPENMKDPTFLVENFLQRIPEDRGKIKNIIEEIRETGKMSPTIKDQAEKILSLVEDTDIYLNRSKGKLEKAMRALEVENPKLPDLLFNMPSFLQALRTDPGNVVLYLTNALDRLTGYERYLTVYKNLLLLKKDDLPQDLPAPSPQKSEPEKSLSDAPKEESQKSSVSQISDIDNLSDDSSEINYVGTARSKTLTRTWEQFKDLLESLQYNTISTYGDSKDLDPSLLGKISPSLARKFLDFITTQKEQATIARLNVVNQEEISEKTKEDIKKLYKFAMQSQPSPNKINSIRMELQEIRINLPEFPDSKALYTLGDLFSREGTYSRPVLLTALKGIDQILDFYEKYLTIYKDATVYQD